MSAAQQVFDTASLFRADSSIHGDQSLFLSDQAKEMRWFLLPSEAQLLLSGSKLTTPAKKPPFEPRDYRLQVKPNPTSLPSAIADSEESKAAGGTELPSSPAVVSDVDAPTRGADVPTEENVSVKFHSPPKSIFKPTTEVDAICSLYYVTSSYNGDLCILSIVSLLEDFSCLFPFSFQAIDEFNMIQDGDKVLVCLSGGKDSLSLLHTLHQYKFQAKGKVRGQMWVWHCGMCVSASRVFVLSWEL